MLRTSSATEVSSLWNLSLFCCHYFNLDYQVTMVLNSPLLFVKIVVKLSQTTIMVSMTLIQHQIRFMLMSVTRWFMEEVSICIKVLQNPVILLQLQVRITLEIIFQNLQGVPKKIRFKPIFEFLTLGGVFLGVKNNSKNFGNKKNIRFLSKILSK